MTFTGIVSIVSLLWFFGGALWLLVAPEGFVRFALIENEKRIHQGVRNLKRALTKLG